MGNRERVNPYKKIGSVRKLKKWWKKCLGEGIPTKRRIIVEYEDLREVMEVRYWFNKLGNDNRYRREGVVNELKKRMAGYGKDV